MSADEQNMLAEKLRELKVTQAKRITLIEAARECGAACAAYGDAFELWSGRFPEEHARIGQYGPNGEHLSHGPGWALLVDGAVDAMVAAERKLVAAARRFYDGSDQVHGASVPR